VLVMQGVRWTTYTLSPFRQKMFPGFWTGLIPRQIKRWKYNFPRVAPPILAGIAVYTWGNWKHDQIARSHWY
jgi:hypothetical protein